LSEFLNYSAILDKIILAKGFFLIKLMASPSLNHNSISALSLGPAVYMSLSQPEF